MMSSSPDAFDRYLVIDDTDDDIGQILTVISERSEGARPRFPDSSGSDR